MRFALIATMALAGSIGSPADKPSTDEQLLKAAGVDGSDQSLLDFFRKRLVSSVDRERIRALIVQLGDDLFANREKASAALVAYGLAAEPLLREAQKSADVEVARRAEECVKQIHQSPAIPAVAAAARAIQSRKPGGAAEVLLAFLPYADDDVVADIIRSTLAAVAVKNGVRDAFLIGALEDKDPVLRAAAAEALIRADANETAERYGRLLHDPDALVRLRAGLALARRQDRDAIPVLIELLGRLSADQAWPISELLEQLAGRGAPSAPLGDDDASRTRCRQAWADWWRANGSNADMARLAAAPPELGYTLLLFLDLGEAMEIDRQNHIRWQIKGLILPLDIQYLPGDRVLVTEHDGNRITERDLQGNVFWERKVDQPLAAQRLRNGNTFIVTMNQIVEIDRAGRIAFTYHPNANDSIMKAQKLPSGEIACVTFGGKFAILDAAGKEIRDFAVQVMTYGGRIDVLPNGHVIVAEMNQHRVVEYDADGKAVWEIDKELSKPIAAVRLANGNTLVTAQEFGAEPNRAVEFDRAGRIVWEYRSGSRVNRAFRR